MRTSAHRRNRAAVCSHGMGREKKRFKIKIATDGSKCEEKKRLRTWTAIVYLN